VIDDESGESMEEVPLLYKTKMSLRVVMAYCKLAVLACKCLCDSRLSR